MFLQVSKLRRFSRGVYIPKCSKTYFGNPVAVWAFWGGVPRSFLLLVGLECFYHGFDRCPNHIDFLKDFIRQSTPKLILATTGSFGRPFGGGSSCNPFGGAHLVT